MEYIPYSNIPEPAKGETVLVTSAQLLVGGCDLHPQDVVGPLGGSDNGTSDKGIGTAESAGDYAQDFRI